MVPGSVGGDAAAEAWVGNMSNREEVEHDFKPLAYFPLTHNKQPEEASPCPLGRSRREIRGCPANSSRREQACAIKRDVSDVADGPI